MKSGEPDAVPYDPIACGLHDELQLRAMRGRPVLVRWRDGEGVEHAEPATITDVFTRGGSEYVTLATGDEIRLDRLIEVDGIAFAGDR